MSRQTNELPGLQAERTELSWERSTIGLIASGTVLLLRQAEPVTLGRAALAAAALLLALQVVWFARRRGRRIKAPRGGSVPDARAEVLLLGWSVAALAAGAFIFLIP
jgi:uncharacterized membrane protein YidH (DUF202 family)